MNGRKAGILSEAESFRLPHWAEEDLILPTWLTAGHENILISITVLEGIWNAFGYEVYTVYSQPANQ